MRIAQLGDLTVRLARGTDGKGGGNGPVVVLLHGFGALGNDLVPLSDVLKVPTGTRFVFPEGPLTLSFGPKGRAGLVAHQHGAHGSGSSGRASPLPNVVAADR